MTKRIALTIELCKLHNFCIDYDEDTGDGIDNKGTGDGIVNDGTGGGIDNWGNVGGTSDNDSTAEGCIAGSNLTECDLASVDNRTYLIIGSAGEFLLPLRISKCVYPLKIQSKNKSGARSLAFTRHSSGRNLFVPLSWY